MSHVWITGVVEVEENITTSDSDGRPLVRRRALSGVAVQISSRPGERDWFSAAGETRTDRDGRFRARLELPALGSQFHVWIAFSGDRLAVCEDAPGDWILGRELDADAGAALVDAGTIVFRDGAAGELGERDHVRRALTWYVAGTAIEYLEGLGAGLSLTHAITIRYPATSPIGSSFVCHATRTAMIHRDASRDDWSVERVLRQVMRLWSGQCAGARAFWPAEKPGHRESDGSDADRFAELAMNELLALLWGRDAARPRAPD